MPRHLLGFVPSNRLSWIFLTSQALGGPILVYFNSEAMVREGLDFSSEEKASEAFSFSYRSTRGGVLPLAALEQAVDTRDGKVIYQGNE